MALLDRSCISLLCKVTTTAANLKSLQMAMPSSMLMILAINPIPIYHSIFRLVNPYVAPVLYIRKPGDDNETIMRFTDDDPFFSEVSNFIDVIEDIEEDPDAGQILSSYEGTILQLSFMSSGGISTQFL